MQLPELWQRPEVSREQKKAMLRCLIDKVMLTRAVRDRTIIRIVWRGGEVTESDIETRVHAMSALSRGAEMEARLLDLARQGIDDMEVATTLTLEGHRSARCSQVKPRTVQLVRQRHRVLQNSKATRARHIAGWLTVAMMAERMSVSSSWIKRRIRAGIITIQRDPRDNRFLFPDTPDSVAALQKLRSGVLGRLVIDPRPAQ